MKKQKIIFMSVLIGLIAGAAGFAQQNAVAPPEWIRGEWQRSENGKPFSLSIKAGEIILDGSSLGELLRTGKIRLNQSETTTGYELFFQYSSGDRYWQREFFLKPKATEKTMTSNFTDSKGAKNQYTYTPKTGIVSSQTQPASPQAPAQPASPTKGAVTSQPASPAKGAVTSQPASPAKGLVTQPASPPSPVQPASPPSPVQPATPAVSTPPPVVTPVAPPASASRQTETRSKIAATARKYLGASYIYGAQTPPRAFDCSGFVGQAYIEGANVTLPRTSKVLATTGNAVNKSNIKPGDIIYFDIQGYGVISHVALVLDSGNMIHAVSEGKGMAITALNDPWYAPKIAGYRNLFINGEVSLSGAIRDGISIGARTTDRPLSEIFIEVTSKAEKSTDGIGMAMDTGLHFTLANKTGKDADFDVYFYQKGTAREKGDHEKISVKSNTAKELVNAFFAEKPGQYIVEVRGAGGAALVERAWNIIE